MIVRACKCKTLLQNFMMVNQMLNNKCVNRAGVCDEGPAHGSVSVILSTARLLSNNEKITSLICSDVVFGMLVPCMAEQKKQYGP